MWRIASEVVHVYRIAFVSTSGTVHFSSTLDSRNSSSRAAKRMLQPPFQSNKVPLSAEPAKTIAKCVYLAKNESKCMLYHFGASERHFSALARFGARQARLKGMVRTSKTDHFFKLAPFLSPLPDLIDFGMAGKLLTSATRRCSPFVDSVSRIWIKPKKSLIGCWAPTATTFGQSAPSPVQLTAGHNGHNRHFERLSLVSSVCRSLCTGKIELYVSWAAYFRGVLPWLQRTAVKPVGFACTGTISRVIVKVTSSSDLEKIRVRSKSTRRQAGRFQRRGLLRTPNKQFWER